MPGSTTKYAIPYSLGTDTISTIDNTSQAQAERVEALFDALIPVGAITPTAKAAPAPAGWLICDGTAVSRTTYAALFAVLSTTFGVGDGSTTFNLPDLRGRVPVGEDGTAGRLDALDARGNAGGVQKAFIVANEIPVSSNPNFSLGGGTSAWVPSAQALAEHSKMQPYQIVNYMIRSGLTV